MARDAHQIGDTLRNQGLDDDLATGKPHGIASCKDLAHTLHLPGRQALPHLGVAPPCDRVSQQQGQCQDKE